MGFLVFKILFLISVSIFVMGLFLFFKPALAIEIQKRFYARINWKIEPIFLKKEIRNTRVMGAFIIFISLFTIAYIAINLIQ